MLAELRIDNFAIIPHLELELGPGLVIFTGETGAGKSIILDAVEAILGARSDPAFIRSGTERASVEAIFKIPETIMPPVCAILKREELFDDAENGSYLTIGREVRREGRNIARVNGHSVNIGLLRELGGYLVDIHGQSEHLSLLEVRHHLELLDRFAGTEELAAAFTSDYQQLQAVHRKLYDVRMAEQEAARHIDLLNFQVKEIEAAQLQPGEVEVLRQDRSRLANSENLVKLAQTTIQLLDEGSPENLSVTDILGQVVRNLGSLVRIDSSLNDLYEQTEAAMETLSDLARELQHYLEQLEFNPKRLDQIEERLDLIHTLERKYGSGIEAILAFAADARAQLDSITHAGERIAALEKQEADLLSEVARKGIDLSEKRHAAAGKLSKAVESELADLHMTGARFAVDFQTRPDSRGLSLPDGRRVSYDANGIEKTEFLIAPNPGEGLKPLVKIASGGETSRLMLALKNVLVRADTIPTLVFDEIDQGIGGRVGSVIGEKLRHLGHDHQVLCITHLPQLAAFGNRHYRVAKMISEGRTITAVDRLEGDARRNELAQMLGGVSEGTLKSAEEMLTAVKEQINK